MRHLNYHPANNFKRIVAYLIDVLPINAALCFISATVFGVRPVVDQLASDRANEAAGYAKLLIVGGTLVIWIFYCIVGELTPWRGTFGKKVMGISVKSISGGKLTFGQVLGRNAAKILSALPLYFGFFAAFISHGNRSWHDSLSGTAVADTK